MARQGVELELVAHDGREAVVALAHVDRVQRNVDPDTRGQAQHARTASRSRTKVSATKSSSTSTATSPTNTR